MMGIRLGKYSRAVLVVSLSVLGTSASLKADDTEIYQTTVDAALAGRPKVLIAIDDSGSMRTVVTDSKPAYGPAATYASVADNTRIYWSTDGKPPPLDTNQYFLASTNRCAESYSGLSKQGFFQSKARYWKDQVANPSCTEDCTTPITNGFWETLSSSAQTPSHVECQVDAINANPHNGSGVADGYAKTDVLDTKAFSETDPEISLADVTWGDETYTFYSAHYMDYVYDSGTIDQTRMQIAQNVITSLIQANTGLDFGILEFNGNWSGVTSNGGRIVHRIIQDMTAEQRTDIVDLVNSVGAHGNTPLCEATMEAYRYLAGDDVVYGLQDDGARPAGLDGDVTPRDQQAEKGGKYVSPTTDCAYTYIVLMTDGLPRLDTDANSAVESLTGQTCELYDVDGEAPAKNCLPKLTEYMANTDLDKDATNGDQFGITYTIGFTTDQKLLSDAAQAGGGKYFTAGNTASLTAAFQGAILDILSAESTFTAPAVAVDTFSRTQSRDDVFYAMFKPDKRIDWHGNIKKLKLDIKNGTATLVDKNGDPAIDPDTGFIKGTATTYWSTTADGQNVDAGGVGALLAARDANTRTIKINTGSGGALQDFNTSNITHTAFGLSDAAQLFTVFDVPNQTELDTLISWARGTDAYDEDKDGNTTENRPWILADMLHSQPLVVNYGALGGRELTDPPDLRIVVGTNAGFVHMFDDSDGQERWAFFPKELAPVLRKRALNPVSSQHVYGVDNTPVLYTFDEDRDGTIEASDGDKAYVYLTLRSGGDAVYALDISNPDSPAFLWMISPSSQCVIDESGVPTPDPCPFAEIGQTWSRPVITRIPGYKDSEGIPKPVLIFGAGYDTNKNNSGVATADSRGRGLYIVDAVTGALVWKVTPADDSATNMQETGLVHSVAAPVAPLDSNGDEITDRVYLADTGGNLWRVDMPGAKLPTASQEDFRIVQMAAMNGGAAATDRRFFNAPDIVRTSYRGDAFDAIAIGSGDRDNPNATDNDDQFYMIRDEQVLPYFTEFVRSTACDTTDDLPDDNRCALPVRESDLYDVTPSTLRGDAMDVEALSIARGWRMDLTADGEKSLSKSITIDGKVFFTTFSPALELTNVCKPLPGTGRLYAVRLGDATRLRDFDGDGDFDPFITLGSVLPETPAPHFGEDKEIRLLTPLGSPTPVCEGEGCPSPGILIPGARLPDPYGTFWYQEEY